MRLSPVVGLPLLVLLFSQVILGEEVTPSKEAAAVTIHYSDDVRPILARKCYACHGPETQEGSVAFSVTETLFQPADSGEIPLQPGDPDQSEVIRRVAESDLDLRMPPRGHDPLTAAEIAILRQWIEQGAKINQHWAFEPVPVVTVPAPQSKTASTHPIDRFIEAQLAEQKLTPAPPTDRRTLIRRLTYDLTGLPPQPQEVEAFVNDAAPDAYEQLVDRLLASPQYGERWARHWLDLVGYAETNSYERDGTKPNAWKYRDYVIRSFNEDKPYDQFVKEQLAGDELPEVTKETLTATGFYRLGIWDDEPADPLLARYDDYDVLLTTISQGLLGLTVNCSRCHDHKIDPIPQADYYRLLAFFQEVPRYNHRGQQSQTDVSSPELIARYTALDDQQRLLHQRMRELEQQGIVKMSAPDQRVSETRERKKLLEEKLQQYLDNEQWDAYSAMKAEDQQLEQARKQLPPRETVLSIGELHQKPEKTHIMLRGNPHVPGDEVTPGFPELFGDPDPVLPAQAENTRSSGGRLLLAEWITSPENRLTARVLVNRVWQHHFGRGIVRSSNNFGLLGTPPTHPDLLNWLSQEFIAGGWKLKPLHRLIVLSQAYQRSSQAVPESLARDPNNDHFWRFDLRRLSAEELRDSVLAATGALNLKMYGPSMYPVLSREVLSTQSVPGLGWGKSSPEEQSRRSIYIFIKRSLIPPELASFDFPDTDTTCEARFTTIQPAQALNMINGDFLKTQAARFAVRLKQENGDDVTAQMRAGLQLVLCRPPAEEEVAAAQQFWQTLQDKHQLTPEQAMHYVCLYLLNLNEFAFLD